MEMHVPLVALIDYRGYQSLARGRRPNSAESQTTRPAVAQSGDDAGDSAARLFEPTLQAWQVPYQFLEPDAESQTLRAAWDHAHARGQPVAVLLT